MIIKAGSKMPKVKSFFDKATSTFTHVVYEDQGTQCAIIDSVMDFDCLFSDEEVFYIGNLKVKAIHVPGHTPADMAYIVEDNIVFIGDTLFMPDVGTARCDFPGGDARTLYKSVHKLFSMPSDTRLFLCHDYPPSDREPAWETTVGEQREKNIQINDSISEEQFVKMRSVRDATLEMPTLILPSIQINIRAGELPSAENNGVRYLKIPLNSL